MKNVQVSMPLSSKTLDTMRVGSDDTVVNGVNVPILPIHIKEYNAIYKSIAQLVDGHIKGDKNLDLHIIAKAGHNIYNYDGNYDYYYAAYIKNKEGKYCISRIQVTLDEQEERVVHDLIWRNRNALKCTRAQVLDAIKERYGNEISFFCDGLYRRQYRSSWQNAGKDGMITAFIENIDIGDCQIAIATYGNVVCLG